MKIKDSVLKNILFSIFENLTNSLAQAPGHPFSPLCQFVSKPS